MVSSYVIDSSSAQATVFVRRAADGSLEKEEQSQDQRAAQVVPPKGEYRLKVTGFAEPFEMPRAEQFGGGTQLMTRLELQIVGGRGDGKTTTVLCGWPTRIGPRSNLGKVYMATKNTGIPEGMKVDVADILGGEFEAYLRPSDKLDDFGKPRYTVIAWDTVAPVGGSGETQSDDDDLWN